MKSDNTLKKILNNTKSHYEDIQKLIKNLQLSLEKEHDKSNLEMLKKIAHLYNLDEEQLLKRFLKKKLKKNLNIDISEDSAFNDSELNDNEDDSVLNEDDNDDNYDNEYENEKFLRKNAKVDEPIYKKIVFEDKEFFYQNKEGGNVFNKEDINKKEIVGNIDLETKKINFI